MPDPEVAEAAQTETSSVESSVEAPATEVAGQTIPDAGRETSFEDQYDFGPPDEVIPSATEAAPTQAAPAAAPAPEGQTAPQFTAQQLARATAVGMQPAQIVALGPQAIETALIQAEQIAAHQQALIQAQQQAAQRQQVPPAPELKPPEPFNADAIKKELLEQGFDEAYANRAVAHEKKLHDMAVDGFEQKKWIVEANKYLHDQSRFSQAQAQQAAMQSVNTDFDTYINGLDPETKKLASDPANKAQILATADVLVRGMTHAGQKLPEKLGEVFESAKNVVLGKQLFGLARESVRRQVETHQSRAISRPSGSEAVRAPKGDDSAAQFATDFMAKIGLGTSFGPIHPTEDL